MSLTSVGLLTDPKLGGNFADVRVLRAGSRFTLYSARETTSDRPVIIKTPNEAGARWLHDALVREASILAATSSHPHIVTMYQRFATDDGRPALLLERCSGSLDDFPLERDNMSLRQAAAVGIKIAGALETVHHAGHAHCDVRPGNILISEFGEPVLAGFDESVRLGGGTGYAPLHITTSHTAPELLEGAAPTPASDVYGLASTLYELVAGRTAFRAYAGESPATGIVRILSNPVRPITAPGVPLDLSDLLTWAMSADPKKRPPSPSWIAEELGRIEQWQGWPRTRMIGA